MICSCTNTRQLTTLIFLLTYNADQGQMTLVVAAISSSSGLTVFQIHRDHAQLACVAAALGIR